jgi:hypothetical protein
MEPIFNSIGHVIGYYHQAGPYRLEIRSKSNNLLGFYIPHSDQTFDKNTRLVGKGNQLGRFIPSDD